MIEVTISKNGKMKELSEEKVLNAVYESLESSKLKEFAMGVSTKFTKQVHFFANVYYIRFEKLFWYKEVDIKFIMSETGKIDLTISRYDENDNNEILFQCVMKLDCEQFIKLTKKLVRYNEIKCSHKINEILEERQKTTEDLLNFCI